MRYLEIGPGDYPVNRRWDLLDSARRPGIDIVARWGEERLPIADGTYDLVYASHVLEHVPWFKTIQALREAFRVLRPGGSIEVWVPDFDTIIDSYRAGRCGDNWRKYNPRSDPWLWLNGRLFTYGPDPNWHRAAFDAQSLRSSLEHAGFRDVHKLTEPRGYDHGIVNLGMQGRRTHV